MTPPAQPSRLKRTLLIGFGLTALALGAVGAFVPLLPTTPFLLLAAACFARSSERFYHWLITHRWLGSYIRNYREHRAMTRRAKAGALLLLWAVLAHTALFAVEALWLHLILLAVGMGVTLHLALLKTYPEEMNQSKHTGAAVGAAPSLSREGVPHE